MQIKWTANLRIGVKWDERASIFVGYCPALNLYSQGRTSDEAKNATFLAIKSYLSIHYARKNLDIALAKAGFMEEVAAEGQGIGASTEEFIGYETSEVSEMSVPFVLRSSSLPGFGSASMQPALQPA